MWTELNRRCDTDNGRPRGRGAEPLPDRHLCAELVGQEDGRTLYCTACWTPFMPQIYSFSVTDESIYGWIVDYEREDKRPAGPPSAPAARELRSRRGLRTAPLRRAVPPA